MTTPVPFGLLLRRLRQQRRFTQTDLAELAESSTRHISFLETARSMPSRDMAMRLAECLELPLRGRNDLLLAAGFAPAYQERSLPEMDTALAAIDKILLAHLPYPAFVMDRHWNVIASNGALPQLYEGCSPKLMGEPLNAVRLILHPEGMGPRIENFLEWRAHTVTALRRQLEKFIDPVISSLLAEVISYPAPPGCVAQPCPSVAQPLVTPLKVATRLGSVSFLNTNTVFGTPNDVTLAELTLEMLFPGDQATVTIAQAMIAETEAESGVGQVV